MKSSANDEIKICTYDGLMSGQRLLIIINTSIFFLSHRVHLARGAQKIGFQVTVASPQDEKSDRIRDLGLAHYALAMGRKSMNPFGEIITLYRFLKCILDVRPDVVHLFTIKPVLYGTLAARCLRVPRIVVTITGLGYLFIKEGIVGNIFRFVVGHCYKWILCSKNVKVIFQNNDDAALFLKNKWVDSSQVQVILGTGVDTQKFCPRATTLTDAVSGPTQILFPARYLKDKGIFELISACKILDAENASFTLVMCGGIDFGNPSSITQEELKDIETLRFVKSLGYCENMSEVYQKVDMVCLPSYREGIPLALIEAAACGLPIVTTDTPGCREVVENNKSGFLVPVKESQLLAQALRQLIQSGELRKKMGLAARERALKLFAMDVVVTENLRCYEIQ